MESWFEKDDPISGFGRRIVCGPLTQPTTQQPEQNAPAADDETARQSDTKLKHPPDKAFRACFVRDILGESNQTRIAEIMTSEGIPANQSQVSRWLKAVDEYRAAGGIVPTPDELNRPQAIDPDIIEMGARLDGLTPRQRPRRDSDADSGDE